MVESESTFHIIAVDCCEHILGALDSIPASQLSALPSKDAVRLSKAANEIDLIVIGVSNYPMRRLFISHLRRIYPEVAVLILRREDGVADAGEQHIRGEFMLSDRSHKNDLEMVSAVRRVLPLKSCVHLNRESNYDLVREVIRVIAEKYSDPDLNLKRVAEGVGTTPSNLSRILNNQVGVSFRQLLRDIRIQKAKRMLASQHYSVKQVAARVGFSDSHYFSRSFRELTGLSASEYRAQDVIFG